MSGYCQCSQALLSVPAGKQVHNCDRSWSTQISHDHENRGGGGEGGGGSGGGGGGGGGSKDWLPHLLL